MVPVYRACVGLCIAVLFLLSMLSCLYLEPFSDIVSYVMANDLEQSVMHSSDLTLENVIRRMTSFCWQYYSVLGKFLYACRKIGVVDEVRDLRRAGRHSAHWLVWRHYHDVTVASAWQLGRVTVDDSLRRYLIQQFRLSVYTLVD